MIYMYTHALIRGAPVTAHIMPIAILYQLVIDAQRLCVIVCMRHGNVLAVPDAHTNICIMYVVLVFDRRNNPAPRFLTQHARLVRSSSSSIDTCTLAWLSFQSAAAVAVDAHRALPPLSLLGR